MMTVIAGKPAGWTAAAGTQRRLQALIACGWSQNQLALRIGMPNQRIAQILRVGTVHATTALAVRALYDDLWDTPPRADDRWSRISVSRSRRHAADRGWPPPQAWDDDVIDDPAAPPPTGWRRAAGPLPGRERVDEALDLFSKGVSLAGAAKRLGVTTEALDRHLHRYGTHVADRKAS